MQHRVTERRNRLLALIVVAIFIAVAIVGPVFFSQPQQLGAQLVVSVLAFVTFGVAARVHLAPDAKLSGWLILGGFLLGYVVLLSLRNDEFRPDQFWFIFSPMGYVAGALAFGVPNQTELRQDTAAGSLSVECWSSRGQVEQPIDDLHALLGHLDGRSLTLIRFRKGPRCLEIAGGLDGRVVSYYSEDAADDGAWYVYAPNPDGTGEQLMYLGDVQGYVSERLWCSISQIRPLMTAFTNHGRIDVRKDSRWVNDGVMAGGTRPSLPRRG